MKKAKIRTEVDLKYFKKRVKIEKNMSVSDSDEKYVYKISHKGVFYVLKGYQIYVEHLVAGNKESADLFKDSIRAISEVFQEYYFSRIASLFNPHFAKPLFLDYTIQPGEKKFSSFYIEIIFEYAGTGLDKLESVTFNDAYNFMRQSANALTLLHDIGMVHFDIKPANMVYDEKSDILKIIDMESAFGAVTRKKATATTRRFDDKMRSTTFEYSPPEVLRKLENKEETPDLKISLDTIDAYCWGMCFCSMLLKKTAGDLRRENKGYKLGLEKNYKDYLEMIKNDLNIIDVKDSLEKEVKHKVKDLLLCALSYKPRSRPAMRALVAEMKSLKSRRRLRLSMLKLKLKTTKSLWKD